MHTYGKLFQIHVWGTSHNPQMGVIIDSVPPGISLEVTDFEADLTRRRTGAYGTSQRSESDVPEIISGVYRGKTTGAPLHIRFTNTGQRSEEYNSREFPRPGHADMVADKKYHGHNDSRGGGFFSGRMTVLLVAAGVVAKLIMKSLQIRSEILYPLNHEAIQQAAKAGDSLGAEIKVHIEGLPAGTGEPFFSSIESEISRIVFSIPGAKAIAFGEGFKADRMYGSDFNDAIINEEGKTETNHDGGINGGIANGNPIVFTVKFKPTPSIRKTQKSWHPKSNSREEISIHGRHDVCYGLRTPVILEAVAAIALLDLSMQKKAKEI
ncbi:MAG: chorismate synthase [Bacteroidota bacterium]